MEYLVFHGLRWIPQVYRAPLLLLAGVLIMAGAATISTAVAPKRRLARFALSGAFIFAAASPTIVKEGFDILHDPALIVAACFLVAFLTLLALSNRAGEPKVHVSLREVFQPELKRDV